MTEKQKYFFIAAVVVLLLLAFWLILRVSKPELFENQPPKLEVEKQLERLPALPEEPATVISYSGHIKALYPETNELLLLTSRGQKKVSYDNLTIFAVSQPLAASATPPPASPGPDLQTESQSAASLNDFQVGDFIRADSLTNIRGLAKFRASKITLIKQ